MRRSPGVLLIALLSSACVDVALEPGQDQAEIVGGVGDSADPAIIMLSTGGFCTGTLVAPQVVLTAAHCVQGSIDAGRTSDGSVRFGPGGGSFDATVGVRDMISHRYYNGGSVTTFDIAMVRLEEDAPAGIEPLSYNRLPVDESYLGAPLKVVGYGVTDGATQEGGGTKRKINLIIDEITPHHLGIGMPGRNICQGDSGGPSILLVDGVETVMAVSSFGSNFCRNRSFVTRTDPFVDFLDEVLAAWSGPCQEDGVCVTEGCGDFADPDCAPCGLDGVCTDDCPRVDLDCPPGGFVSETCTADVDCESRVCVEALDDPRIQYCSTECDPDAAQPCDSPLGQCHEDDDGVFRCYFRGTTPSAQGSPCEDDGACRSGLCDLDQGICAEPCGDGQATCAEPYECLEVGDVDACTLAGDGGGCGCSAGPGGAGGGFFLALLTLVGLTRSRQRATF